MTGFTAAQVPDQSGRTFLVTGANTGIGFEVTRVLAARGGRVLLGCRSEERAGQAIARIAAETPGADLAWLPLDLADLASVRRAADLASQEARLDVLVNNAGVMVPPLIRTAQGFDLQMGVNHLGPFALTGLLLPKLAEAPAPRVVVTASLAHKRGNIDFDDLQAERGGNRLQRYFDSKLANMLHFTELDARLRAAGSPIKAIGCHPGVAATEVMRHLGPLRVFTPVLSLVLNSAEKGAWPALQAATDPAVQGGDYVGSLALGEMRGPSGHATRTVRSRREDLRTRLWDVSVALTGVDPGI